MYFVYLVENQIMKPPTPPRLRMMLVFADIPTFQCHNLWGLSSAKTYLLIFARFNVTAIVIAIIYFAVKHASAVAQLSSAINKFAQQFCAQFITCAMQNRQFQLCIEHQFAQFEDCAPSCTYLGAVLWIVGIRAPLFSVRFNSYNVVRWEPLNSITSNTLTMDSDAPSRGSC